MAIPSQCTYNPQVTSYISMNVPTTPWYLRTNSTVTKKVWQQLLCFLKTCKVEVDLWKFILQSCSRPLTKQLWCLRGFNKYCSLLKMDKQQFCSLLLAAKTVFSCPSVFQVSNSNKIINKFLKIISQPWPTFFQ